MSNKKSKTLADYGRPSQEAPPQSEGRVHFPQIMANGYLGTTDANTKELTKGDFKHDLTGLQNLTGAQIKLLVILFDSLKWSYERDASTQRRRLVTNLQGYHDRPNIKLPYIALKSMGALVRKVTGDKKPKQTQYDAVERDLLGLQKCAVQWHKPAPGGGGDYLQGYVSLVIAHKDANDKTLGLYFHPIVLEMERYLTIPPTIFDEVRRRRGGNSLPDYFYRLIMLQALHGGRGTKPYNKRTSDLIEEIGLDKVTNAKRKRAKDEPLRLLTEALTILADPEIGLISGPSITPQVVKWQTGPRGRAPKQAALEVVPPPLLPAH
jgi:hypothetical protein